jgi:hypothetical protein
MKKCLLVICHSRAEHLEKCLASFVEARGSEAYMIVVVRQVGHDDVASVVNQVRDRVNLVIEVEADARPEESIRRNRFLGYFACYQTLDADLVLALEDDVLISTDALEFVTDMFVRYESDRNFMGINLGSIEPLREDLVDTYSLLRYGLHGQASVLSKRTWTKLVRSPIVLENPGGHFDLAIESYLKRGFMVTPNNSRHLDYGYGGTHASDDPQSNYFAGIRASWVGGSVSERLPWRLRQITHHWREDAVPYRAWANAYYRFVYPWRFRRARRDQSN